MHTHAHASVLSHSFQPEHLPAGYLEMDTDLNIRKADMYSGLVLGWPSTMLVNQKLHR